MLLRNDIYSSSCIPRKTSCVCLSFAPLIFFAPFFLPHRDIQYSMAFFCEVSDTGQLRNVSVVSYNRALCSHSPLPKLQGHLSCLASQPHCKQGIESRTSGDWGRGSRGFWESIFFFFHPGPWRRKGLLSGPISGELDKPWTCLHLHRLLWKNGASMARARLGKLGAYV